MSRSNAFILFLLSFIVGFLLREMLFGITHEKDLQKDRIDISAEQSVIVPAVEKPVFELVKLQIPPKVIRGSYFEAVGQLKKIREDSGTFLVMVHLISVDGKTKVDAGNIPILSPKEMPAEGEVKTYAFRVPVPPGTPLGRYNVYLDLYKAKGSDQKNLVFVPYANIWPRSTLGSIEVVSYSAGN